MACLSRNSSEPTPMAFASQPHRDQTYSRARPQDIELAHRFVIRKKPTVEDAQKLARKRGGKCLSTNYVKSAAKMLWQCAKGHQWEATYNHIQGGKWCPFCIGRGRTIKDIQALAVKRGGKCLSKTFLRMNGKLQWACDKRHEWEAIPSSVLRGSWCPVCSGRVPLRIEDFIQLARKRGGECLSSNYVNSFTKLRWRCAKGHQWEAVPSSIKTGTWCPFCIGRGRTIEDMRLLAESRGGQCLSPILAGRKKRLRWRCAEGHMWSSMPKNTLRGAWCRICARKRIPKKYSVQDFKRIARQRGGDCLLDRIQELLTNCFGNVRTATGGKHCQEASSGVVGVPTASVVIKPSGTCRV
jgi:hypothetical protein